MDISSVIETKKQLIQAHASQIETHAYANQIVSLASYRGYENEQNGHYLEVYKKIDLNTVESLCSDTGTTTELSKYKKIVHLQNLWLELLSTDPSLSHQLLRADYRSVAIYGFGILGKALYTYLKKSACTVQYIIDKNIKLTSDIPIYHSTENLPPVDAIIITTLGGFENISKEIHQTNSIKCLSFETILLNSQGALK